MLYVQADGTCSGNTPKLVYLKLNEVRQRAVECDHQIGDTRTRVQRKGRPSLVATAQNRIYPRGTPGKLGEHTKYSKQNNFMKLIICAHFKYSIC